MIASGNTKEDLKTTHTFKFDKLINIIECLEQITEMKEPELEKTNEVVGYVTSSTNSSDTDPEPLTFYTSNDSEEEYKDEKYVNSRPPLAPKPYGKCENRISKDICSNTQ